MQCNKNGQINGKAELFRYVHGRRLDSGCGRHTGYGLQPLADLFKTAVPEAVLSGAAAYESSGDCSMLEAIASRDKTTQADVAEYLITSKNICWLTVADN